jgi:hydrogenase maturation protease
VTTDRIVRVLGVGNVLMGDDGLGPSVVRLLEARYTFSDDVEIVDAGTPGLDFTPFLSDAHAVVIVDTVQSDVPPGTIRLYRGDEIFQGPPPDRTNPHQPGLREALMAAELTDSRPEEVVLVGVVPSSTETGTALSETLRARLDEVIGAVVDELDRLGGRPVEREVPLEPDLWWE